MPSLGELAAKFGGSVSEGAETVPSGVAIGSNHIEPGYLFIAAQGARVHGIDFLDDAIARGASAVLTDREANYPVSSLIHPDPRSIAGLVAGEVYGNSNVALIGITGTNGKTSTAFYLQRLLSNLGQDSGLIT
ncbi:MAG: Mur ligase domain-containing protein, partial [Aquiluna sp.]